MSNNITREDLDALIAFLNGPEPMLTQSRNVALFEEEWSRWLGCKRSVFVNSGSSANFLTLAALKHLKGVGEVIVPPLTWVSDIAAVLQNGFEPKFADIDPRSLAMDENAILSRLTPRTRAVFLTHILGFDGLTDRLLTALAKENVMLLEDACESHGATHGEKKLGTLGRASCFSFYYAHHLSTIEGGMLCTDDEEFYQVFRMLRSHGMVREASSAALKKKYAEEHPDLHPDFIFALPGYNVRSTELNAVIGRSQLPRLDSNNLKRRRNFELFLKNLDPTRYRTDFKLEGSVNYAFVLVLRDPAPKLRDRVMAELSAAGIEFRRGTSGGGNQLRQPYLRPYLKQGAWLDYPQTEHIHFFGFYIGNYPDLEEEKILKLCRLLNSVA